MSETSIIIPKDEYESLKIKADLFDQYIETEELTKEEEIAISKALKGPFLTKSEFLKRHKYLA
jgi:hypothetical protein